MSTVESDKYIGRYLLIGITIMDDEENVVEQFQTHGIIVSIDMEKSVVINKADNTGFYSIPPDLENIHTATTGEYRIRSTGEIVVNPDYTSTWTVYPSAGRTADDYKKDGFAL